MTGRSSTIGRALHRATLLLHRYLGIGLGLLMAVWCLSGFVMMYVHYPALSETTRIEGLRTIDWRDCCVVDAALMADDDRIASFEIEMIGERPVLRLNPAVGGPRLVDLRGHGMLPGIATLDAMSVARSFADRLTFGEKPSSLGDVTRDQWTVYGGFNQDRPLHRFALNDPAGTELYVSSKDGRAVQVTTSRERFWNWLGAVPHWLYPTLLRQNVELWSQTVIWSSLLGCFLTITGLYIGIRQFGRGRGRRFGSPHGGLKLWHHVPGLVFGILTLTWVGSGLLSMNPWGLLETDGIAADQYQIRGKAPAWPELRHLLKVLPHAGLPEQTVSVASAPLAGGLLAIAKSHDGTQLRLDHEGRPTPLTGREVASIAARLAPSQSVTWSTMSVEDNYYFSHGRTVASLPVIRMLIAGDNPVRYYLDPVSGQLVNKIDRNAAWYRWLHYGLHRFDLTPALRARPFWDGLMLPLLLGVSLVTVTGTYLGWRRLRGERRSVRQSIDPIAARTGQPAT